LLLLLLFTPAVAVCFYLCLEHKSQTHTPEKE
jgi:hypothetical protein